MTTPMARDPLRLGTWDAGAAAWPPPCLGQQRTLGWLRVCPYVTPGGLASRCSRWRRDLEGKLSSSQLITGRAGPPPSAALGSDSPSVPEQIPRILCSASSASCVTLARHEHTNTDRYGFRIQRAPSRSKWPAVTGPWLQAARREGAEGRRLRGEGAAVWTDPRSSGPVPHPPQASAVATCLVPDAAPYMSPAWRCTRLVCLSLLSRHLTQMPPRGPHVVCHPYSQGPAA